MPGGGILDGLVIDAWGAIMEPSGAPSGGSRYYISVRTSPAQSGQERVPAKRLDSAVVTILKRIKLLASHWRLEDLRAVLRRVVVLDDSIVLQLEKRVCLTVWRSHEPILQRITTSNVLRLVSTCLIKGEEISEAGTAICFKAPRHARARKIRKRSPRTAVLFKHPG